MVNLNFNDNGRTYFRAILLDEIKENPVFGHGLRSDKSLLLGVNEEINEAHNDFLVYYIT